MSDLLKKASLKDLPDEVKNSLIKAVVARIHAYRTLDKMNKLTDEGEKELKSLIKIHKELIDET